MPVRLIVKTVICPEVPWTAQSTIARGRKVPRRIVLTILPNSHEMTVLLPNKALLTIGKHGSKSVLVCTLSLISDSLLSKLILRGFDPRS